MERGRRTNRPRVATLGLIAVVAVAGGCGLRAAVPSARLATKPVAGAPHVVTLGGSGLVGVSYPSSALMEEVLVYDASGSPDTAVLWCAIDVTTGRSTLWHLADGVAKSVAKTPDGVFLSGPSLSPDGARAAFYLVTAEREGFLVDQADLQLVVASVRERQRMTLDLGRCEHWRRPRWVSPNRLVTDSADGAAVIGLDGETLRRERTIAGTWNPVVDPTGAVLALASKSGVVIANLATPAAPIELPAGVGVEPGCWDVKGTLYTSRAYDPNPGYFGWPGQDVAEWDVHELKLLRSVSIDEADPDLLSHPRGGFLSTRLGGWALLRWTRAYVRHYLPRRRPAFVASTSSDVVVWSYGGKHAMEDAREFRNLIAWGQRREQRGTPP